MAKAGGYKSKLLEAVKSLSEERIKALADFAAYLREREEGEATAEILGNEELAQQVRRSRKVWAEGRKGEFVSLAYESRSPEGKEAPGRTGGAVQPAHRRATGCV
jgi:hypothetical protein